MYPGEEWDKTTRTFDSESAIEKYKVDYAKINLDPMSQTVDITQLREAVKKRLQEINGFDQFFRPQNMLSTEVLLSAGIRAKLRTVNF